MHKNWLQVNRGKRKLLLNSLSLGGFWGSSLRPDLMAPGYYKKHSYQRNVYADMKHKSPKIGSKTARNDGARRGADALRTPPRLLFVVRPHP